MRALFRIVVLVALLLAVLVGVVVWMAGGVQRPRTFEAPAVGAAADPSTRTSTSTIRVLVWNIAWGYGQGSEGSGRAKPASHFEETLERMASVIRRTEADVVLLQEVDFNCTRSHGIDQGRRLGELAGLPYMAPAVSWTANWVPFPYWPPSDHFGRMSSGGAVLSRFPVRQNRVTLLPKPDTNPGYYNLFYLFRYVQRAVLETPSGPINIFNAHLEAFDPDNRQAQAARYAELLEESTGEPVIAGGDLNSIPADAAQRDGFADEPETSFEGDSTYATIASVPGLSDVFAAGATDAKNAYTFPAHAPTRRLDHLFASEAFEVVSARVVSEAHDASDHRPLLVELGVPDEP